MSSSATGVGMPICFLWAILLILTQKSSQKFGDVLGIRREGVTALRCSEPLRSKVGGASKPSPYFAGWDRLGTACFFPPPCFAGWDRLGNF